MINKYFIFYKILKLVVEFSVYDRNFVFVTRFLNVNELELVLKNLYGFINFLVSFFDSKIRISLLTNTENFERNFLLFDGFMFKIDNSNGLYLFLKEKINDFLNKYGEEEKISLDSDFKIKINILFLVDEKKRYFSKILKMENLFKNVNVFNFMMFSFYRFKQIFFENLWKIYN